MSVQIEELADRDIGRRVVFKTPWGPAEMGVISRWDERYVFVTYSTCRAQAYATSPDHLYLLPARRRAARARAAAG